MTNEELMLAIEQKAQEVAQVLEQALADGVQVKRDHNGITIGDKFVMPSAAGDACVVLHFNSDAIREALRPDVDTLEERRKTLQAQLSELNKEIEERKAQ
jgi:hypothetical protein